MSVAHFLAGENGNLSSGIKQGGMASEMGGDGQCFLLHRLLYLQQQDEMLQSVLVKEALSKRESALLSSYSCYP